MTPSALSGVLGTVPLGGEWEEGRERREEGRGEGRGGRGRGERGEGRDILYFVI